MASLKIDNLTSSIDSLLNQNIVSCSNDIKDYYNLSTIYQQALNSNQSELMNLSKEIQNDLASLFNELYNFNNYLNQYINDYITVGQYLADGSQSEVTSIPTSNLLKHGLTLKNDNLKKINVINLKLVVDYEKIFEKKDKK